MKLNMINCILLVLLLLITMVLLKCGTSALVINFLDFFILFHLQVLLIIILPLFFAIFFHLQFLMITQMTKILFLLFPKLRMQIFPKTLFFPTMKQVSLLIFHFKKPLIQQQISFLMIILTLTSLEKKLKNFSFSLHHRLILFLAVSFTIKLMEQPWVLLQLLSLLTTSWVFTNLSGLMNRISTNLNFI